MRAVTVVLSKGTIHQEVVVVRYLSVLQVCCSLRTWYWDGLRCRPSAPSFDHTLMLVTLLSSASGNAGSESIATLARTKGCTGSAIAYDPALVSLHAPVSRTGLGNRLGAYLSAAAFAKGLSASAVTHWAVGRRSGRGSEDIDGETIMRVMMLPGSLRLAEAEHDLGLANWSADLSNSTMRKTFRANGHRAWRWAKITQDMVTWSEDYQRHAALDMAVDNIMASVGNITTSLLTPSSCDSLGLGMASLYVPEYAWACSLYAALRSRAELRPASTPSCLTRSAYLTAYHQVQQARPYTAHTPAQLW